MKKIDWPIALASLALSILLWLVVFTQSQKPIAPVSFAVRPTPEGLDKERLAIVELPDRIRFSATGPESLMQSFPPDSVTAAIDLTNATEGEASYPVKIFPETLESLIANRPVMAKVKIEKISRRVVPVEVEAQGSLSDDSLVMRDTLLDPREVSISGPESLVRKTNRARARLDLATVLPQDTRPVILGLELLDDNDKPVGELVRPDPLFVRVTPVLEVAPTERALLVVPQFTGQPAAGYLPEGYEIDPPQITLRGSPLRTARVTKVFLEPIDVSGWKETRTVTARVRIPEGFRPVGNVTSVRVTYKVRPDPNATPLPAAPPVLGTPQNP